MKMKPFHILQIIIVAVILSWLSGLVIFSLKNSHLPPVPDQVDSIVVLTGGPSRIEKGLEFFAAGKSKYFFISGAHPDVLVKEIAAQWKGQNPLPPCCIILGHKATTTTENAEETEEWVKSQNIQSILLVTSDYHMARARLELKHALPDVKIWHYPVSAYLPHQSRAWLFFKEYNKVLYRWAQIKFASIAKLD